MRSYWVGFRAWSMTVPGLAVAPFFVAEKLNLSQKGLAITAMPPALHRSPVVRCRG